MRVLTFFVIVVLIAGCATGPGTGSANDPDSDPKETTATEPATDASSDAASTADEAAFDLSGAWKGDIVAGAQRIPTIIRIERTDAGGYTASMDSPDQGVFDVPVESVTVKGRDIEFDVSIAQALYNASLDDSGKRMEGVWSQGGGKFELNVEYQSEIAARRGRPQDPQPPFPYDEEEVRFPNEAAGIELAGTITVPTGNGPFPGVVLISGSGQQNRNEEVYGHRPFLVLADALTRAGIAVLRYDDRGVGGSEAGPDLMNATTWDFSTDAEAAYQHLRRHDKVDSRRVGLLGHSEGGAIAPIIASNDPTVAFVVLLAGPGIAGVELIMLQNEAMLKTAGVTADLISVVNEANRKIFTAIVETPDDKTAAEIITPIMKGLGMQNEQINAQLQALLSRWYRAFLTYDPRPVLERLSCAVLALNGTLDVQVTYEENLAAIQAALEKAPTDDFRVEAMQGLNHMFQTAQTGGVDEHPKIEETFAEAALELIASWILER